MATATQTIAEMMIQTDTSVGARANSRLNPSAAIMSAAYAPRHARPEEERDVDRRPDVAEGAQHQASLGGRDRDHDADQRREEHDREVQMDRRDAWSGEGERQATVTPTRPRPTMTPRGASSAIGKAAKARQPAPRVSAMTAEHGDLGGRTGAHETLWAHYPRTRRAVIRLEGIEPSSHLSATPR